jgi:hypothetical protein
VKPCFLAQILDEGHWRALQTRRVTVVRQGAVLSPFQGSGIRGSPTGG